MAASGTLLFLIAALALCGLAAAEESGAIIVKENDDSFSIPAFVIGVRESIEGCVIAAVLLNACHKSGQLHMKPWVWFGVIVGTVSFLVAGAICLIIFYAIRENMPGAGKAAFEGVLAVLACCILTHISLKFLRLKDLIMKWEGKLVQDKQGDSAGSDPASAPSRSAGCWASFLDWIGDFRAALNIRNQAIDKDQQGELTPKVIVVLAWSAIFREGLETVIFLLPLTGHTEEKGLVAGCLAGIAVGIAFGIFVLYVGKKLLLDPTWFFNLTTLFIFFIAAGLSTYSVIELEQIAAPQLLKMNHPVLYRPMYNIGCLHEVFGRVWRDQMETKCFLPENEGYDEFGNLKPNAVGMVFRALLGYRATPTMLMCIMYCLYWMIVTSIMMWRYKQGTLFSRFGHVAGNPFALDSEENSKTSTKASTLVGQPLLQEPSVKGLVQHQSMFPGTMQPEMIFMQPMQPVYHQPAFAPYGTPQMQIGVA